MTAHDQPLRLRLAHLYPDLMNLYGDRGNIIALRRRCEARGIALDVEEIGIGDAFDADRYDLIFMGGGQDREQQRIAADLCDVKGPAIRQAVDAGTPALAVCGGYQLFGRSYQLAPGVELPGLGIFPVRTIHGGEGSARCIGNVEAVWDGGTLAGFENHGGRTYLEPGATPLATVRSGFGNNGADGTEGATAGNAYGTYLHGSLLPKNPAFADHLLLLALRRKYGDGAALQPIDDSLEERAQERAIAAARADGARRHGSWWSLRR